MKIILADAVEGLRRIPAESINTVVTSPPYYGLRDYGVDGQIGLEKSSTEYIARLVEVFREVWRVLKPDGTVWVVIGDSYAHDSKWGGSSGGKHAKALHGNTGIGRTRTTTGLKEKDLIGIPWMFAFAMRDDGWWLRQDIVWAKPNPMPESVRDRCTRSHEYIFMFSKSRKYYFDGEAISEPTAESTTKRLAQNIDAQTGSARVPGKTNGPMKAVAPRYGGNKYTATPDKFYRTKSGNAYDYRPRRNKRDVWTVTTRGYKGAHFATFPPDLIRPCVLAGCPEGGVVLDPFCGSGTTLQVARECGRDGVGIELNKEYLSLIVNRVGDIEVEDTDG